MIQRQYLQGSMFEAAFGAIEQWIEGLIEPALQRLDEVLADEQLLEVVLGRLGRGEQQPPNPDHGHSPLAQTTTKSTAATMTSQTNIFAPEISYQCSGP
jgi:hypothetical protein